MIYKHTCDDLRILYEGSYIGYRSGGAVIPGKVMGFDVRKGQPHMLIHLGLKRRRLHIKEDDPRLVLDVGVFGLRMDRRGRSAVDYTPFDQKQWRRSLLPDKIKLTSLSGRELQSVTGNIDNHGLIGDPFGVADALFNPLFYGREVAVQRVISGQSLSAAIDSDFAIAAKNRSRQRLLYKGGSCIGKFKDDLCEEVILPSNLIQLRESLEGLGFKVEVA